MIKFTIKVVIAFSILIISSFSQATLITNLTDAELVARNFDDAEDFLSSDLENINYISRDGWDIAWASPVNAELWYGLPTYSQFDSGEELKNTLYSPLLQKNWLFVEDSGLDLSALINSLSLTDFIRKDAFGNDVYIQATQYFNSDFHYVDANNLESGQIRSSWVAQEDAPFSFIFEYFGQYETFYVRNSLDRPSTPVPEPSTLMIFALALIALALKSRFSN